MSNTPDSTVKYLIQVCDGATCHVRKSKKIVKAIWNELGLSEEMDTTGDNKFKVELAQCFEICGPGPLMKVNGELYEHLTPDSALEIIKNLE